MDPGSKAYPCSQPRGVMLKKESFQLLFCPRPVRAVALLCLLASDPQDSRLLLALTSVFLAFALLFMLRSAVV